MQQPNHLKSEAIVYQFEQRFGESPSVLSRAPGRINLIGEHTDYNEGFVLPASIDREAVCAFRQNETGHYRVHALDLNQRCEILAAELGPQPEQWANYVLGVVHELRVLGHVIPGFDCAFSCNVPQGAGLSSSAAIESAVVRGLNMLFNLKLDKWTMVRVGQAAENGFVGANTGMLDQFASIFGEQHTALLLDCRSLEVARQAIKLPGHELVVLNTGVKHNHVESGYGNRRADCESAVATLLANGWKGTALRDLVGSDLKKYKSLFSEQVYRRVKFVVEENARVLRAVQQLDEGDVAGFGESLLQGHWGLSELYEVSCEESDSVVRFSESHPACKGARQMGGGFGGCVLCVVSTDAVVEFIEEAQAHYASLYELILEPLSVQIGPGARAQKLIEEASKVPALDLDNASHRRLNILTGEWVLVSPHRAKRPWQGQVEDAVIDERPSYDPSCYLCPGNTRMGGKVNPAYQHTYVFDNDFAALQNEASEAVSYQEGLLVAESERGLCRVLCFSPNHSKTMASLSLTELVAVIDTWRAQYAELGALPYINHVQIFENKGAMMGCSNPHPHGQIWAQSTPPDLVMSKGQHQLDYYRESAGSTLLSSYLEQEIATETRVIYVDDHFVALVPWWAVWPFEVMIAPRRPMAHIGQLEAVEQQAFAKTLAEVTQRYDLLFATSFPYSSGIHQAPTDGADYAHYHWHMEFKPPLLRSATVKKFMVGYELFGMPQRDITAEGAAEMLRGVI